VVINIPIGTRLVSYYAVQFSGGTSYITTIAIKNDAKLAKNSSAEFNSDSKFTTMSLTLLLIDPAKLF
jgi:hypothetical protein